MSELWTDEHGAKSASAKDGIYIINNAELPEHKKSFDTDTRRICYFNGSNSRDTGQHKHDKGWRSSKRVCEDGRVLVKISISEGSELEW